MTVAIPTSRYKKAPRVRLKYIEFPALAKNTTPNPRTLRKECWFMLFRVENDLHDF